MCIAIYKSADKEISKETLQECWDHNPDGAGYMYNVNGHLKVKKGYFKFEDFWKSYTNSCQGKKAVLHFRIKTHGEINKENCHPFNINDNLAFVHNGIIGAVETKSDKTKSDTWHFNDHILKPLINKYSDILEADSFQLMIGDFVGSSKLVFLDNQDNVKIFNEDKGTWDDGVWYSNTSYKPRQTYVAPKNKQTENKIIPFDGTNLNKPVQTYYPQKQKDFGQGSLVELRTRWQGFLYGDEGIVQSVNADFTANILMYHLNTNRGEMCYRVPFAIIEPLDYELSEQDDEAWAQSFNI